MLFFRFGRDLLSRIHYDGIFYTLLNNIFKPICLGMQIGLPEALLKRWNSWQTENPAHLVLLHW